MSSDAVNISNRIILEKVVKISNTLIPPTHTVERHKTGGFCLPAQTADNFFVAVFQFVQTTLLLSPFNY